MNCSHSLACSAAHDWGLGMGEARDLAHQRETHFVPTTHSVPPVSPPAPPCAPAGTPPAPPLGITTPLPLPPVPDCRLPSIARLCECSRFVVYALVSSSRTVTKFQTQEKTQKRGVQQQKSNEGNPDSRKSRQLPKKPLKESAERITGTPGAPVRHAGTSLQGVIAAVPWRREKGGVVGKTGCCGMCPWNGGLLLSEGCR